MMKTFITEEINKTCLLLSSFVSNTQLLQCVEDITNRCIAVLRAGHKILFAGNGGSAADSQHLAAELVVRLRYSRPALAAIALTTDTSILTAMSNDYSFDYIFSRQIEALGQSGDAFIGISTSGKSKNILEALCVAKAKGLVTIGFAGQDVTSMLKFCDHILSVPASEASKVQEVHITIGHIICTLIEEKLSGN